MKRPCEPWIVGVLCIVAMLELALTSYADDTPPLEVEVRVTYVSGESLFLDHGRRDGLRVGDMVRFLAAGADVEAEIESVSSKTARARRSGTIEIAVGTVGRVTIPSERLVDGETDPTPKPERDPPKRQDLPWSRDVLPRDADQPLLAPTFSLTSADRPVDLRGRVFLGWRGTWDRAGDRDARDFETRLGTRLQLDNALGVGGRFEFEGELYRRDFDLDGADEDPTQRGRLERLSYLWGWERKASTRVELGRFISDDLPELGVIDGIDVAARTPLGQFGVIAGGYPEPGLHRGTGDSTTVAAYHRLRLGTEQRFSLTSAYQHSWHRGKNDRDLILGRLEWTPGTQWSIFGSVWWDYYTGSDSLKSSGFELTEFFGSVRYRPSRAHSFRVSVSQSRWPELRRDEFDVVPATVQRSRRRRARLSTRHRLFAHFRVDTRVRAWSDRDDDGVGGEVTFRTPDWPGPGWELLATIGYQDNVYGSRPLLRAGISHSGRSHSVQLLYVHAEQDYDTLLVGSESLTSQRALAIFDWFAGAHWTWSSQLEAAFGDEEDSTAAHLYLQYRF